MSFSAVWLQMDTTPKFRILGVTTNVVLENPLLSCIVVYHLVHINVQYMVMKYTKKNCSKSTVWFNYDIKLIKCSLIVQETQGIVCEEGIDVDDYNISDDHHTDGMQCIYILY